jgi:hypothetical protein
MQLKQTSFLMLSASLLFLPGCELLKQKEEAASAPTSAKVPAVHKESAVPADAKQAAPVGEVLVTLYDGKESRATVKDFELYMEEFLEAQPQYRAIIEFMPGAKENIFEGMVNELLLTEWARNNKIDQKKEFQADLDKILKYGKRSLYVKYFQEAHPVSVSAGEVRKYYDENKNTIPRLMITPESVKARAVIFKDKATAEAFNAKVKESKADFVTAAADAKETVKDLGEVTAQSFEVDGQLRKKVLEAKKFPAIELVALSDNTYAVVEVLSRTEPQYVPFDEIKDEIENVLKQQKGAELLMKELEKLKQEFKLKVNKEYFEREKTAKEQQMQQQQGEQAPAKEQAQKPSAPRRAA